MPTVKVITFAEAIQQTELKKRHLLLGNGFSISRFPDLFRYGSLLEEADFSQCSEAREAFNRLNTTSFETVIQALNQAVTLASVYGGDDASTQRMFGQAQTLKTVLVETIAGRHPERPSEVSDAEFESCRVFLGQFAGESRNQGSGNNRRGCIYSLNYDLLLYWSLLHKTSVEIQHDDGFRAPDDDLTASHVTWDGEDSVTQTIFYLHGALHLFDGGHELQKKCWERSGRVALIGQIRASLDKGTFPLFVAEGLSSEKFDRIRHSGYLHKALRSFRQSCKTQSAVLFVFGHSLAASDDHILKQIEKGAIANVFIGLHGDQSSEENKKTIRRANIMSTARSDRHPLQVTFFDSNSANVWGSSSTT